MDDFPLEVICQKDAGRIYECQVLKARVTELESALAKSASREAALVEKVKLAEEALKEISLNYWRPGDDFCHPEGCGSPGVANAALAKIKEAS